MALGKRSERLFVAIIEDRHLNPEPLVPDGTESVKSKKRSKAPKQHQKEEKMISSNITSKIMKEALIQQKEVQEEAEARDKANNSFLAEWEPPKVEDDDEFDGFTETQSHFGSEEEIIEQDEKLLEAFLSKDKSPQRTLAYLIVQRIKEKDVTVASENRPVPKLD